MLSSEIIAVFIYIAILATVALLSYKRHQSANDYIMGGRSLNFWLIALAAHSSDMSSWLLMGYPSVIFLGGLFNAWVAIGLIIFMFLNWHFIAPRIRVMTERFGSLTFSSYFESRFADTSGMIRLVTALMQLLFYAFYVTAGLVSMGILINALFGVNYHIAVMVSVCIVIPYLFIGGYRTLAWTDFFQGLFMLLVVLVVPLYALPYVGGWEGLREALDKNQISLSLIPDTSFATLRSIFFAAVSWGLGYFGQPHIVTKFMGIKDVKEMPKSKYVGMTWQVITLSMATLIGIIGVGFFPEGIPNVELIFVDMVRTLFSPLLASFVLCAILAATISTMDSQILVLASSLTEDLYRRIFRKEASSKELLFISRLCVLLVGVLSTLLALSNQSTIFSLVEYAWFGLGSSFGPLIVTSLYAKQINKFGAWAGILSGGLTAAVWPLINDHFSINIPTLLPGFSAGLIAIFALSKLTQKWHAHRFEPNLEWEKNN